MWNPGNQIKKLRQYFKLTQDEFATAVSTKRNSISMIESGRNKPTFELIADICGVFNLPADFFLSEDNPEAFESYFEGISLRKNDTNNVNLTTKSLSRPTGNKVAAPIKVHKSLTLLAQSSLLYLEFHLRDILLNLRLIEEDSTGKKFDRKTFASEHENVSALISQLKSNLKTDLLPDHSIIEGLIKLDEGIRVYLDQIRDLSRELYLQNSKR